MVFAVGIVAMVSWQDAATWVVIATAVAGIFTAGAARTWRSERDATRDQVDRLRAEFADERAQQAGNVERLQTQFELEREEQTRVRHDLKEELGGLRKLRDPTEVLQHVLAKLDTVGATVAALLERAEERAALRDATIVATQREIVERLEQLADKISGQVAEAVAEVVSEQLQPEKE